MKIIVIWVLGIMGFVIAANIFFVLNPNFMSMYGATIGFFVAPILFLALLVGLMVTAAVLDRKAKKANQPSKDIASQNP